MRKRNVFYSLMAIGLFALLIPGTHAQVPQATPQATVSTEINAHVEAYYPSLGLYVTAPQNTTAPMLTSFSVSMRSPGNSSYQIYMGSALERSGTFPWHGIVNLTSGPASGARLTVIIDSSVLGISKTIYFTLDFMSPQTYINYISSHEKVLNQLTYYDAGGLAALALILGIAFLRMHLPIQRANIRKSRIKGGLERIV